MISPLPKGGGGPWQTQGTPEAARRAWKDQESEKLATSGEVAVGAADALAAALRPWFDGSAALDYHNFFSILEWQARFFEMTAEDPQMPKQRKQTKGLRKQR